MSITKAKAGVEVSADWLSQAEVLICPEPGCNYGFLHPVGVEVNAGGVITDVTDEGTKMRESEAEGRGVTITIRFQGECRHNFLVRYQFH